MFERLPIYTYTAPRRPFQYSDMNMNAMHRPNSHQQVQPSYLASSQRKAINTLLHQIATQTRQTDTNTYRITICRLCTKFKLKARLDSKLETPLLESTSLDSTTGHSQTHDFQIAMFELGASPDKSRGLRTQCGFVGGRRAPAGSAVCEIS